MRREVCRICGKADCYRHCPNAVDGVHEPDPKTLAYTDGACDIDRIVVDANCLHCGQSGAASVLVADIEWE